MTTHTPAPAQQALLTEEEMIACFKDAIQRARAQGLVDAGPHEYVAAGAVALLSKLRAPVAEPKRAPVDDGICWSSKEIQRRQKEEDEARAAYYHSRASAPVAGEAHNKPSAEHFTPPFGNCSFRMCDLPGQCRGEGKCHHPSDAAPQASEAVRDAGPAASEDADQKMREVLQWIVDDAASGGVAKLRPQQEKRARAALSAQPGAQKGGSDAE